MITQVCAGTFGVLDEDLKILQPMIVLYVNHDLPPPQLCTAQVHLIPPSFTLFVMPLFFYCCMCPSPMVEIRGDIARLSIALRDRVTKYYRRLSTIHSVSARSNVSCKHSVKHSLSTTISRMTAFRLHGILWEWLELQQRQLFDPLVTRLHSRIVKIRDRFGLGYLNAFSLRPPASTRVRDVALLV